MNVPHGKKIAILTQSGLLTLEGLILYLHSLKQDDRFDSRLLFQFLKQESGSVLRQSHADMIAFAKASQMNSDGYAFKAIERRVTKDGNEFLWLNWFQASVLL